MHAQAVQPQSNSTKRPRQAGLWHHQHVSHASQPCSDETRSCCARSTAADLTPKMAPHSLPCNAVEGGLVNISEAGTILVPTDEAVYHLLALAGITSIDDSFQKLEQLTASLLAIFVYHVIPNVTLTSANLTNGMSLPSALRDGGNFTVQVNCTSGNISFTGFKNATAPTADSGNSTNDVTNSALVLRPDIPILGTGGVMHIINKVLQPPLGAFIKSAVEFTPLVKEAFSDTPLVG